MAVGFGLFAIGIGCVHPNQSLPPASAHPTLQPLHNRRHRILGSFDRYIGHCWLRILSASGAARNGGAAWSASVTPDVKLAGYFLLML